MATRFDAGAIKGLQRTPQGGLKVSAYLTRTGVFEYRRSDGTLTRELRHPDHVFNADSIATLEDAVLTHLHPNRVTPKDYQKLSIGHVRDPSRDDADNVSYVKGTVIVQDGKAVEGVENGKLKELSCGYSCDVINEPGEYNGEKYDSIQTNIRYNHVGIGPLNWGRAGKSVALHLDSAGDMVFEDKEDGKMETEKIDGIDYKVGSPEHIQALRKARDDAKGRADGLNVELTNAVTRADKAGEDLEALKRERNDAASPERISKLVAERSDLLGKATKILGDKWTDVRADGLVKTPREIHVEAIAKSDPTFKADGESDDYIRGRFETLTATREDSRQTIRESIKTAQLPQNSKKGAAKTDGQQKRADSLEKRRKMSEQPLTLSKGS